MYNINRRKFLGLFGCGCCSMFLPSCSTVPITERKQLSIIPESRINRQAAVAYENFRNKAKIIKSGKDLKDILEIGNKMEKAVSAFFLNKGQDDPTKNFEWDYILVENDKMVNAWCMPGGKIAVYTGLLKVTKNKDALATVMGHEIAHAVARHSVERMSHAMTINLGTTVADIFLGGAINRTRNTVGQNTGLAFTWQGKLNLKNSKFSSDNSPLDQKCDIRDLNKYSKSYLNHLIKADEMLASMLISLNNLYFYQQFMLEIRKNIKNRTLF